MLAHDVVVCLKLLSLRREAWLRSSPEVTPAL